MRRLVNKLGQNVTVLDKEESLNTNVSKVIGEDYKKFNRNDVVFIKAGTGIGKTYFVKNILATETLETIEEAVYDELNFMQEGNKKILFLCNRKMLKDQTMNDLNKTNTMGIKVMTYHAIEFLVRSGEKINNKWDYIVCDECHYWFADSVFNNGSYYSYKWVMEQIGKSCILFMTATEDNIFELCMHDLTYFYKMENNFGHLGEIKEVDGKTIAKVIENVQFGINDEAMICFFEIAKDAWLLSRHNPNGGIANVNFYCSPSGKSIYKNYNDKKTIAYMKKNAKIPPYVRVLNTTKVLDNGFNIDDRRVKHIYIDTIDLVTFKQILGRKRQGILLDATGNKIEDENGILIRDAKDTFTLYVRVPNKKRLEGAIKKAQKQLDFIDKVISHEKGEISYYKLDSIGKFLDDKTRGKFNSTQYYLLDDAIEKAFHNPLQKIKLESDIKQWTIWKECRQSFYYDVHLYIGREFDMDNDRIEFVNFHEDLRTVEDLINPIINRKLFEDEQDSLMESFKLANFIRSFNLVNGKGTIGLKTLNNLFEELNLQYVIQSKKEWTRSSENYSKTYWIITKTENLSHVI